MSYYTCMIPCGIFVLMLHDIGDFWLNLAKMVRDLNLMPGMGLDLLYGVLCIFWIYPRCVVPCMTYIRMQCLYLVGTWGPFANEYINFGKYAVFWYQQTVLIVLCGMNFFWSAMLLSTGIGKLLGGKKVYRNDWEEELKTNKKNKGLNKEKLKK